VLDSDPDVIIGTTRLGAIVGAWKKTIHDTPLIVDHIDPISQLREESGLLKAAFISQLEKLSFRTSDHVLVVYEEELSRVEEWTDNVTKTSLGVDYKRFADPSKVVLREAHDIFLSYLDDEKKTVTYIGGLEPIYNIEIMLDAIDHLDDWQLLILGDGSQREQIETAALQYENIIYLGTVEHKWIPGILRFSDVGINLCNDQNTLKLLEYGAAGLPTVNIKGDAEERFEGLVEFCSLKPQDVAQAITVASESSVGRFQSFTKQFDWRSIADTYQDVIKSVTR
jgi:glycosyltransferase involved in cell wall biosynthesis